MYFDLKHTLKKVKIITKKRSYEEGDSKGLLAKEVDIWEKQQMDMIIDHHQPLDSSCSKTR